MDEILENKSIRVRYGTEDQVLADYANFGWKCINKVLLNRFGNPLPLNEVLSEADKREKCFWDLSLNRVISQEKSERIASLEYEYSCLAPCDTSFGRGRITATVFLTIGFIICVILSISSILGDGENPMAGFTAAVVMASMCLGGIVAIVVPGALRVRNRVIRNEESVVRRKQILIDAKKILEE